LTLLVWPNGGLLGRWLRMRQADSRILIEDALKHIQKAGIKNQPSTIESISGVLEISPNQAATLLEEMKSRELVKFQGGKVLLTNTGQEYALHIIRAHRLWEHYLAEETGFAADEWHAQADHYEHSLSPEEASALSSQLGNPTHDPHGDPIPTADGDLVPHGGHPLTDLEPNEDAVIVHLEDEPEAISAQLLAEGLYPGMEVHILERTPQRIRFWANGSEHLLAPIVAANISVRSIPAIQAAPKTKARTLRSLDVGSSAVVQGISPRCRGAERRRLLDLGLVPGTKIEAEMISPSGDPTAYRVRDTLIALRTEQADLIHLEPIQEVHS
jgi:DtxR family Mn-dependent transcriptional regulator